MEDKLMYQPRRPLVHVNWADIRKLQVGGSAKRPRYPWKWCAHGYGFEVVGQHFDLVRQRILEVGRKTGLLFDLAESNRGTVLVWRVDYSIVPSRSTRGKPRSRKLQLTPRKKPVDISPTAH